MENLTFQDIIKNSVLKMVPQQLDPMAFFLTLLVAFLVGTAIFIVYRKCFIGVVYDHSFNISLVVMTVLVSVIIVTISTNITLSLGMVGALSIVRYRTAVKNPLDLMFMFWAITSGIAIGAQYYYIAIIALIFITIVLVFLRYIKGEEKTYVLVINYDNTLEIEEDVRRELGEHHGKLRSKIIKNEIVELTVELQLKMENINITNNLANIHGVHDVTFVQYRGSYDI